MKDNRIKKGVAELERMGDIVATPDETGIEHLYLVRMYMPETNRVEIQPLSLERYVKQINRSAQVESVWDFLKYVDKYGVENETEIWLRKRDESLFVTGIIDPSREDSHSVSFAPTHTKQWKLWTSRNNEWLDKEELAQFLNRAIINVYPLDNDSRAMLEFERELSESGDGVFKATEVQGTGPHKGFTAYKYVTMGAELQQREFTVPLKFNIQLAPFNELDEAHIIEVKFQCDITRSAARFRYTLLNHYWATETAIRQLFKPIADQDKWLTFGLEALDY